MGVVSIAVSVFEHGANILNSKELDLVITDLKNSVYQTYFDRASAHFSSFKQSLKIANSDNNPETEIRAAIHHLYDAFFSLYDIAEKTIEKRTIINIHYSEDYVPFKEDVYVPCCRIAVIIYGLYTFLCEFSKAEIWKVYIIKNFQKARTCLFKHLDHYENRIEKDLYIHLKNFSDTYVKRKIGYDYGSGGYHSLNGNGFEFRYFITEAGVKYLKTTMVVLENEVKAALNNKYLKCPEITNEIL